MWLKLRICHRSVLHFVPRSNHRNCLFPFILPNIRVQRLQIHQCAFRQLIPQPDHNLTSAFSTILLGFAVYSTETDATVYIKYQATFKCGKFNIKPGAVLYRVGFTSLSLPVAMVFVPLKYLPSLGRH